jgi:TrmH family RNA methyltransferase
MENRAGVPLSLGLHSPKLDAVGALKTNAGRAEQGRFIIEGPTMLEEALRAGAAIEAVYATEAGHDRFRGLVAGLRSPIYLVPERALARLSDLETPPGILAVVPQQKLSPESVVDGGGPALLLAGINDPGNAGTLLRSAEIFGVERVLFGDDGVDPYNPKVVRGSMGAIFRLRFAKIAPDGVAALAQRADYKVVATDPSGDPLDRFTFEPRSIIAVGNERRGVAGWLPGWDAAVSIPQRGEGQSLNAAIAGSIILYALMQQMDKSRKSPEKP